MSSRRGSRFFLDQCALYTSWGRKAVEHLLCAVCQDILDDPKVTPCDHHFCASCCESLMQSQIKTCPLCNKPTHSVSTGKRDAAGNAVEAWLFAEPNKSFLRVLDGTPMLCDNEGCAEVVALGDYLLHKASQCTHRRVKCEIEGCEVEVKSWQLGEHMKHCPHRSIRCACCNELVTGGCQVALCNKSCIGELRNSFKLEKTKVMEESRLEKNCLTNCIQLLQWQLHEAQRQVQSLKAELVDTARPLLHIFNCFLHLLSSQQARKSGESKKKRLSEFISDAKSPKPAVPTSETQQLDGTEEHERELQRDSAVDWAKVESAL